MGVGFCSTMKVARSSDHRMRSEEHTSELQSHLNLVCRLLLEKKKRNRFLYQVYRHLRYHPTLRQKFPKAGSTSGAPEGSTAWTSALQASPAHPSLCAYASCLI